MEGLQRQVMEGLERQVMVHWGLSYTLHVLETGIMPSKVTPPLMFGLCNK